LNIFPNPARTYLNVTLGSTYTSDLTLKLVDGSGQVLQERKLSQAAGTTVSLPVSAYPQGHYYLQITGADGTRQTNKVLIAR